MQEHSITIKKPSIRSFGKENSPINNSQITKIEDCINKNHDQIALEHLKSQSDNEIKHEFTNNDNYG